MFASIPTLARRLAAPALVLVALLFAWSGAAEASAHEHHHAAAIHHGEHAQPAAEAAPPAAAPERHDQSRNDHSRHEHGGNGGDHGDCHCMSAACASVLPPAVPAHKALKVSARHDRPLAARAQALAGVGPPAKPPRT